MRRQIGITNVRLDLGGLRRGPAGGPAALHDAGIVAVLETLGHRVVAQHEILQDDTAGPGLDPRARYLEPIASACARLADTIELCLRSGRFPLILGGDHSLSMGSVAGLVRYFRPQGKELGVLWIDAHADMNTPETSPSGNLHGMPLAALLGHGPNALTQLSGESPALAPKNVVIFGVREVDAAEDLLVHRSGVRVFKRAEIARRGVDACLAETLDLLRGASAGIHLSFDLDACNPIWARGMTTPAHEGLDCDEALAICDQLGRSGLLSSMEFVELNPFTDTENRMGQLTLRLVESALGSTARTELSSQIGCERPRPEFSFGRKGSRRVGILAQSLYREMKAQGFMKAEIVDLASALLGELILHIKEANSPEPASSGCAPADRGVGGHYSSR